jgi:hypothetical protein
MLRDLRRSDLARTDARQVTDLVNSLLQSLHDSSSRSIPSLSPVGSFLPVSEFSPKSRQARFNIASDASAPHVPSAVL